MRTQIFGYWEMGTAAGLVGGPALASIASMSQFTAIVDGPGEACACFIAVLAVWLFCAAAFCFPSDTELNNNTLGIADAPCWFDAAMNRDQLVVQLLLSGSTIVRLFLRLAWEAAAVMVLATHFCLGHQNSGYGIVATFMLYMGAQSLFLRFCKHFDDHTLVRLCEGIELCGLLMMFRMPNTIEQTLKEDVMESTSWTRLGFFLLGSGMFYTGNCMTAAPLSSWATKHGPRSESLLLWAHLSIQFGVCAGGFLSRLFITMDPHQNVLVVMLLPVVIAQLALSELGMGMGVKDFAINLQAKKPSATYRRRRLTSEWKNSE